MALRPFQGPEFRAKSAGRRAAPTREEAERIAILALGHIAADSDRLDRFLALTGLAPESMRAAAAEPGFLRAVLDHVCGHEPDLLAFAQAAGLPPEQIGLAAQVFAADEGWNG